MGLRFRKILPILPGIRLNITSKGISSISLGVPGATLNINKKGSVVTTVGIPGSGMSYSKWVGHIKSNK